MRHPAVATALVGTCAGLDAPIGLGLEIGLEGGDLFLDLYEVQAAHRQPGDDGYD